MGVFLSSCVTIRFEHNADNYSHICWKNFVKTKQNYFLTDNKLTTIDSETTFIAAGLLTFINQIKSHEYFSPN